MKKNKITRNRPSKYKKSLFKIDLPFKKALKKIVSIDSKRK